MIQKYIVFVTTICSVEKITINNCYAFICKHAMIR